MTDKYDSFYKRYANQTLDWLPMDTKELYNQNIKQKYKMLEENGWINNHFTYKFNSDGFRSLEFTDDPTIMCLGCSFTCGVGLPVESIWPELLAKNLNLRCANLGVGASSMDTAFRLASGYIDKIKPKIVVCLIPPIHRFEIIGSDITQIIPGWIPNGLDSFYSKWLETEFNADLNCEKNLLAIQMLCHSRNIKFVSYDSLELADPRYQTAFARDLAHPGAMYHTIFSNKVLTEL